MNVKKLALISRICLYALAGLGLFFLWKNGASWLGEVSRYSWNLNAGQLVLSAILLILSLSLTPSGWVVICRSMGSKISTAELFAAWYSSQLGRYIPGKIWLFAGRAGYLKARGMKLSRAGATTAYELFFTVASVGLIVVILALISPEVFQHSGGRAAAIAASSAILLLPLLHPVQSYLCKRKGIDHEELPSLKTAAFSVLIYSSLWLVRGLALFLLLKGTGLTELNFAHSLAAAPLSWLAGYIVFFVPGGIGVREAAAAAIAAPGLIAPAAIAIAGQRIFMALVEIVLALLNSSKIKFDKKAGGINVQE